MTKNRVRRAQTMPPGPPSADQCRYVLVRVNSDVSNDRDRSGANQQSNYRNYRYHFGTSSKSTGSLSLSTSAAPSQSSAKRKKAKHAKTEHEHPAADTPDSCFVPPATLRNGFSGVIIASAAHRKALVKSWSSVQDQQELWVDVLFTLLRRQPDLHQLFAFRNSTVGPALRKNARFRQHAAIMVVFFQDMINLLDENQQKVISDRAQCLGRRHASVLAARCEQVRADWWSIFSAAIFDTIMAHISVKGANLYILWHIFVTKITENVALGFLAAHLDSAVGGKGCHHHHHSKSKAKFEPMPPSAAMPTIYEYDDDEGARSNSTSKTGSRSSLLPTPRSRRCQKVTGVKTHVSGARIVNKNGVTRDSTPRPKSMTEAINQSNSRMNRSATAQPTPLTDDSDVDQHRSWLSRMSMRLNPFRRRRHPSPDCASARTVPTDRQVSKSIKSSRSLTERSITRDLMDMSFTQSAVSEPVEGQQSMAHLMDIGTKGLLSESTDLDNDCSVESVISDDNNNLTRVALASLEEWDQFDLLQQQAAELSQIGQSLELRDSNKMGGLSSINYKNSGTTTTSAWTTNSTSAAVVPQTLTQNSYRVMFEYIPRNTDELELQTGDIVNVAEKCDDGWFIGVSTRTGKMGTFPGNYVRAV